MSKSIEGNFADWESSTFGYGYGSGEQHILAALRTFMQLMPSEGCYDYAELEAKLTPTVAWLMINALCRVSVISYGSSPRYGWLSENGRALHSFCMSRTLDELVRICTTQPDVDVCYPDVCNCGPEGYVEGAVCPNPFWRGH